MILDFHLYLYIIRIVFLYAFALLYSLILPLICHLGFGSLDLLIVLDYFILNFMCLVNSLISDGVRSKFDQVYSSVQDWVINYCSNLLYFRVIPFD